MDPLFRGDWQAVFKARKYGLRFVDGWPSIVLFVFSKGNRSGILTFASQSHSVEKTAQALSR